MQACITLELRPLRRGTAVPHLCYIRLVLYQTSLTPQIDYYEANNPSVGWDGLTTWSTYQGGNGVTYFSLGMSVQVNYHSTKNYSAAKTQSVSAHEFGHALSLGHNRVCVLMNPHTSTRYGSSCGYINTPRAADTNGANALY